MTPHVVVTGSEGFLMRYLVVELLASGYRVTGVDTCQRYGQRVHPHHGHPAFRLIHGDAADPAVLAAAAGTGCDYLVLGAAAVGGVGYFHERPYEIMAANEQIMLTGVEYGRQQFLAGTLRRAVYISSSMVYECVSDMPLHEGDELRSPPPQTSYGFQKLAGERLLESCRAQFGLPCTVIRPFNCVGSGELEVQDLKAILAGTKSWKAADAHVIPDLIIKCLRGVDAPLQVIGSGRQVRHFTHGKDLARGIRRAMEIPEAEGEAYNLASSESTDVLTLARQIWSRLRPEQPFVWESQPGYALDVQVRIPSVTKAATQLDWRAETSLDAALDEIFGELQLL